MTGHTAKLRLALPARAGAAPLLTLASLAAACFPRVRASVFGGGPCLWAWVQGGGGGHSSYLCLLEHVEEPQVAFKIRW